MTLLIIWLLCGIVSAVVASSRGGNGCLYSILGFILGPFGIILAFVAGPSGAQAGTSVVAVHEKPTQLASVADELGKLQDLYERGVLTDEEFEVQKKRLLDS